MIPDEPPTSSETQEMTRAREAFIGPYRIDLRIGDGGMGVVYKCSDPKLRRFVALKVLKEKYLHDAKSIERFRREAQAIASLSHPNIVQIHAIEESAGGPPHLVMEFIDGPSADGLLRKDGPMDQARALAITRQAALGLKAALGKGIIHRDVKPSNLLLAADGTVKIVDFGLAKEIEGAQSLTEEGLVVGTPHYISPEQGRGQKVDQRSDIYSLGSTLYHLVTGRPPFEADSQLAVIVAHLNQTPEPPHLVRPGLSPDLSAVVGKMMAKDPDRRYQDYTELLGDLERLERGEAIRGRAAADGAATFRRERRSAPVWFWALLGCAAVLAAGAVLAVVLRSLSPSGSGAGIIQKLDGWYLRRDADTECLDLQFSHPPAGIPRADLAQALFLLDRSDETTGSRTAAAAPAQLGLEFPGPSLKLKDLQGPAAFRIPFERIDEIHIQGIRTEGTVDLGIAIAHPLGSRLRSLLAALRTGPEGPGAAAMDERSVPLRASRHGEELALPSPPPRMRRLGPGPYDIDIILRTEGPSTRVHLTVRRSGGSAEIVYSTGPAQGSGGVLVPGTDWAGGVLLFWAPSPLRKATVTIARLTLVGRLGRDGPLEAFPQEP